MVSSKGQSVMKRLDWYLLRLKERYQEYITSNFLISYQKSGRTWLRQILANYMSEYYGYPYAKDMAKLIGPVRAARIIYSHANHLSGGIEYSHRYQRRLNGKRVLLQVRSPVELMPDYYNQLKKRVAIDAVDDMNFSDFIRHEKYGVSSVVEFMNFWYSSRSQFEAFYILRYEDALQDIKGVMTDMLLFFKVPIDNELLHKAIRDVENKTEHIRENGVSVSSAGKLISREEGQSGNGQEFFYVSEKDRLYLNTALSRLDTGLGY